MQRRESLLNSLGELVAAATGTQTGAPARRRGAADLPARILDGRVRKGRDDEMTVVALRALR